MNLADALAAAAPQVDVSMWGAALENAFARFEFNTPRRQAAALGQFLVEAGPKLSATAEDMYYSSADRLVAIFPREIPTMQAALQYVDQPQALGNLVYANRDGNGDVASGDGYLFRGRGLIQITGRTAYTRLAGALGMPLADVPAYCETPAGAALSGCWWLNINGALPLADAWEISTITRQVNGPAMEGAAERLGYANAILQALGG